MTRTLARARSAVCHALNIERRGRTWLLVSSREPVGHLLLSTKGQASELQLSEETSPFFHCHFLFPELGCVSTHVCCSGRGLPLLWLA